MEANNKIADLFVRRMRLEMLSKEVRVRFKTSGCYVATFGVKQYQGIFLMNIGITPINQFCIHHETIPISTGYTHSFHSGLMWIVYIGMSQN